MCRWQDKFKGTIIHSEGYKNAADYEGQKVVVVGSGNSGNIHPPHLYSDGGCIFD